MHSRIITLNVSSNEEEIYEMMNGAADYVDERDIDEDWGNEILERIGTVDREQHIFRPDKDKVEMQLRNAYEYYQEHEVSCFIEFIDPLKVYSAASALEDKYGIYIYDDWEGYPVPWLQFLRNLYRNKELVNKEYSITGIYDYHF